MPARGVSRKVSPSIKQSKQERLDDLGRGNMHTGVVVWLVELESGISPFENSGLNQSLAPHVALGFVSLSPLPPPFKGVVARANRELQ
jgi:hypothetical protein